MTAEMIHTCSYACERPECIRAQRDELAARLTAETSNARGEWVLVPREPTVGMLNAASIGPLNYAAMLAAAPPPAAARGDVRGLEYVPGRLDREAPARVWLQIDTTGDNDERDDAWPGPEHVTWQDESIGGLEIQYVRADLALAAEGVRCETCNDRGQVGGPVGQTAESFGYETFPCPDCAEGVQTGEVEQRARELLAHFGETDLRSGERAIGHSGPENGEWETYIEVSVETLARIAAALSQQPEARGVVDALELVVGSVKWDRTDPVSVEAMRRAQVALTEARNVR